MGLNFSDIPLKKVYFNNIELSKIYFNDIKIYDKAGLPAGTKIIFKGWADWAELYSLLPNVHPSSSSYKYIEMPIKAYSLAYGQYREYKYLVAGQPPKAGLPGDFNSQINVCTSLGTPMTTFVSAIAAIILTEDFTFENEALMQWFIDNTYLDKEENAIAMISTRTDLITVNKNANYTSMYNHLPQLDINGWQISYLDGICGISTKYSEEFYVHYLIFEDNGYELIICDNSKLDEEYLYPVDDIGLEWPLMLKDDFIKQWFLDNTNVTTNNIIYV